MTRVWFNGRLVKDHLAMPPGERGYLLGDGVFETIAVVRGKPLWLVPHLRRMKESAGQLGIPFNEAAIRDGLEAVLKEAPSPFAVLRISLSRGEATRGLAAEGEKPSLLISLAPLFTSMLFQPATLASVSPRRNEDAPTSRLKTLSYADNIIAAREAAATGADDGLMLNTAGRIASSTIANIFLVKGRRLVTPALGEGILPGIMRQALIAGAGVLGYGVEEREVPVFELPAADGVFLTNSLRFIRPVTAFNGEAIKQADLSRLMTALAASARQQCGVDPRLL
jgi:branched-chain amino acid aminotransferase